MRVSPGPQLAPALGATVRASTAADADAIQAIARAAWRATYGGLIGEEARERYIERAYGTAWLAELHARGDVRGFLALEGGKAVGFAMLSLGSPADDPPGAVLRSLYLQPNCQGKGHGARLLAAVRQAAQEVGEPCLWVAVHEQLAAARSWYEAHGFVYGGPASTTVDVEKITRAVYRLPLEPPAARR